MNENEKETKRTDGEGKRRRMAGRQSGKRERERRSRIRETIEGRRETGKSNESN